MELTSIELALLVKEMSSAVRDAKVINAYRMPDGSYVLRLRVAGEKRDLRIAPRRCLFLADGVYENHAELDQFCRSMRRLLRGLKVIDITSVEGERIVELTFGYVWEKLRTLVAELFPGGRMLILDGEGKVLAFSNGGSQTKLGEVYLRPEPRKTVLEPGEASRILKSLDGSVKVGVALGKELGLGRKYSDEVLARAGIDPKTPLASLEEEGIHSVVSAIANLVSELGTPNPSIYRDGSCIPSPIILRSLSSKGIEPERVTSLNAAVMKCYEEFLLRQSEQKVAKEVDLEVRRLEREIEEKLGIVSSLKSDAEKKRKAADLIFQNLHVLEQARVLALQKREPVWPIYEIDWRTCVARAVISDVEIEINLKYPASKQASSLYDEAKRVMKGAENVEAEVRELSRMKDELLSRPASPSIEVKVVKKRSEWYHAYRWSYTSSGRLMVAGRDASSNIRLLKRHTQSGDIVFHAEVKGSPVLILKEGEKAGEGEVAEAASFCACYSRAWREGLSNVSVYWVRPEQISFTPPPGTYLPRGSFIVRPPKNYIVAELKLAIGIRTEPHLEVICGSENWVSSVSEAFIVVIPGEERASKLVARLAELVETKTGIKLSRAEIEGAASLVPYGRGSLASPFRA